MAKLELIVADHDPRVPPPETRSSVYIYEAPVRIWHWGNAFCILILCVTGWFIASPPPTMPGEASDHFLMGYIRFVHFAAGQILTIAFFCRALWAFWGNSHARQLFALPFWRPRWWAEIWLEIRWYAFAAKEPRKYEGHNPLAQLAMFFMFTVMTSFMIVTGFALYGEGQGAGHWMHRITEWVVPLFGSSMAVHTFHHLGMWVVVVFIIIHIYAAIREDIMSRQSIISTMISGERMFKDNRP